MKEFKTAAIVLAAGQGKRMETDVPKQYLMLRGKPVLYYSLKAFEESEIDEIILVTGRNEVDYCKREIKEKFGFQKISAIVEGGSERYHSVYQGLCALSGMNYVLIHDGARPLVDSVIISRAVACVQKYGACVTGMPVKDTVKIADDKKVVMETPPRDKVWLIQTPQAFEYDLIRGAYDELFRQNITNVTDDAMVLELIRSYPVKLTEGSYENIKITTPEDIPLAEVFLANRKG